METTTGQKPNIKTIDLLNQVKEGIVVCDYQKRIRYINQLGAKIIDTTPDQCVGKFYDAVFIPTSKIMNNDHHEPIFRVLENGDFIKDSIHLKTKNNENLYLEIRISPLHDKNQNIIGAIQFFSIPQYSGSSDDISPKTFDLLKSHVSNTTWKQIKFTARTNNMAPAFKRYLTVVFLDLVNFSTMSERLDSEKVIDVLDYFFRNVEDTVRRYDGEVDKFIGDAMLITFPSAENGVRCCIDILLKDIEIVNEYFRTQNLPDLQLHIGINSGWVIQGNIGTSYRRETTVIGDTVNIAARVQSLSPPNELWITSKTFSELGNLQRLFDQVDRTKLKGKIQQIMLYEFNHNKMPIEHKVLVFEPSVSTQNTLRSNLNKLGMQHVIMVEDYNLIGPWIDPSKIKMIVTGPSISPRLVQMIKDDIDKKAKGQISLIPITSEHIHDKTKKVYERLGLKVFIPLISTKGWEKLGKIIKKDAMETIPKKKVKKEEDPFEKLERGESIPEPPTTLEAVIGEMNTDVETTPESKQAFEKQEIKEEIHENTMPSSTGQGLPGGVSLSIKDDTIGINIAKKLVVSQMEALSKNVEKSYVYRYNRKINGLEINLQYLPMEHITSQFLSSLIGSLDFIQNKKQTNLKILFPQGFDSSIYKEVQQNFPYNFVE